MRSSTAPGLCALLLFAACTDSTTAPERPQLQPTAATASGTPGWLLDDSLEVRVVTAEGRPVAGTLVTWSAASPGAVIRPDTVRTNAEGRARAAYAPGWTLGPQTVRATSTDGEATFTVTATGMRLTQVQMAARRVCGLDADGRMWCWAKYQNPTGPTTLPAAGRPLPVASSLRFTVLRGNEYARAPNDAFCAITTTGELWCARDSDFTGPWYTTSAVPTLRRVDTPVPFRDIELGGDRGEYACGIDTTNVAWCRGRNTRGELGDGTRDDRAEWTPVSGGLRWTELALSGFEASCGLALNGVPYCWGLGASDLVPPPHAGDALLTPRAVGLTLPPLRRLSAAQLGLCGIAAAGSAELLCWGTMVPTRTVDPSTASPLRDLPTTATSLGGDWAGGRFVHNGRLYRFGYNGGEVADLEFYGDEQLAPEPTGVMRLVTRNSSYWCVEHAAGATICADKRERPVAVPLPMTP
ncbi:MAG TPA: Ig-like domain-containing protein [Gemmatimonadales bacterium]|nr:Ig-like domain-containing protein [Gemmatimonadales bacterium]